MDKRPILDNKISAKDFADFYWLKEELMMFCRKEGLKRSGRKRELSIRIEHYLKTGIKEETNRKKPVAHKSTFDWHKEKLMTTTVMTDNYKNTENVRSFFKDAIGPQFKFNVKFMNWMKSNIGLTLGDAIEQWHEIKLQSKSKTDPKEISPQFEYNTYIRDFLKDNPTLSRNIGIKLWKIKKSLRGTNEYNQKDFDLINE